MDINNEYSLSSKEDIYHLLHRLDIVHEAMLDGNEDMLCVYADFERVLRQLTEISYIKEYVNIQVGKRPLVVSEFGKSIEEICAKRFNISVEEYIEKLDESVTELCEINNDNWVKFIDKKYKNKIIVVKEPDNSSKSKIEDGTHVNYSGSSKSEFVRNLNDYEYNNEELEQLKHYQCFLEEEVKKAEEINDTQRLKKLTKLNIDVRKDINIVRKSQGEILDHQNSSGRRSFVSYDQNIEEIIDKHIEQLQFKKNEQSDEVDILERVEEIKKVAKSVLTNRQYIIFQFYYLNGLTQQEIAVIIGSDQRNITNDLKIIIKKIQAKL